MVAIFLPYLLDLVDYSEAPKFVPANLKYSGILLESYFSISHIAHKVCLNYILINLYLLYFVASGGHFTDTVIVRQIFLVPVIHKTKIKMAEMVKMVKMVKIISTWILPKVEMAKITSYYIILIRYK
jgi:hypothetical protein